MVENKVIHRPDYLAALERHRVTSGLIKMITGIRRCGKSTILKMYQDTLRSGGIQDEQILAINFEDFDNKPLLDGTKLYQFVKKRTAKNKQNYVFLDEVQLVSEFAEVINSLRMRKNIDLYVTGSNSSLLADRLPKILGGRYIQIHMLPLSFREYMSGYKDEAFIAKCDGQFKANGSLMGDGFANQDIIFQQYLESGSFPETLVYRKSATAWDQEGIREYLSHIYQSIIMRDVMLHDDVKELPQLTRVVNFLFSNIGSETSINNMVGVVNNEFKLRPNDKKLYAPMLEKYLEALLDCFVFYRVERHTNGKQLLRTNAKYYAVDTGLRYYLLGGTAQTDAGHLLENVVYLELLRRGYKINTGKMGDKEIDFVAQKPGGLIEYYQVAQSVMDENTLAREIEPLREQAKKDNYPKFLLTRDYDHNNYKGIQHINVLDWLLEK
ncbi:MAG: ATP-binding protein [Treponema sp.]|jgi:predicted AAA+ superfamily ATPase|nr:ATP-binding protein [Treponema sp.]